MLQHWSRSVWWCKRKLMLRLQKRKTKTVTVTWNLVLELKYDTVNKKKIKKMITPCPVGQATEIFTCPTVLIVIPWNQNWIIMAHTYMDTPKCAHIQTKQDQIGTPIHTYTDAHTHTHTHTAYNAHKEFVTCQVLAWHRVHLAQHKDTQCTMCNPRCAACRVLA